MKCKYSIIIPTCNEELYIDKVIMSLLEFNDCEIIISDGGSTDRTIELVNNHSVTVVKSQLGRGIQLNEGVKIANGEILCFLHGDTFLPDNTQNILNTFFKIKSNKICRFKLEFDIGHWLLDKYKTFSKYDSVYTRFGDMFIAVRKDFFLELGGFPNWKTFEDVEFLRKASLITKVNVINAEVVSSARTFAKYGLIKGQIYNGYLISKYILGFRKFIEGNNYYNRKQKIVRASIILFLKYPVEGKVKTRLAKTIGNTNATLIYKELSESIIKSLDKVKNIYKYIFYSDNNDEHLVKDWISKKYFFTSQDGADLGERMQSAFRLVFSHGAEKVIIIGTDIPDLTNELIENAINKLDEKDLVIGPSPDGGYYLLGMKKYNPFLFEGITYSTGTVLEETIKIAEQNSLSYLMLDSLLDIDTEEELKKWRDEGKNKILIKKISKIYS